ncbi:recombinase family protein [soil metagenome]
MACKRAIAYTRVSSAQQAGDDKFSHEYQEERIRRACKARGYDVVMVLYEVEKRWELDRPELNKARQAIRDGKADVLMSMTMDRFSSEQTHLYILLFEIEQAGGQLEFADQHYEDTLEGEFLRNVANFMAKVEIERISRRARQGHTGARNAGHYTGRRPLGYRIDKDKHLAVDQSEAPLVRRIFSDVAEGVPLRHLIDVLEQEGYTTSQGGSQWYTKTIRGIIKNTVYKGLWRGGKTETHREKVLGQVKPVTSKRPEEEQGPIFPCARIVTDDLWERAGARLALNAETSARNNKSPENHLLRSFAFCGECGHALHARNAIKGKRRARYHCGNQRKRACPKPSILQEKLDAEVWERVWETVMNPGHVLQKIIEQAHDGTLELRIAELNALIEGLEKQVKGLTKGIGNAWADGDEPLAKDLEAQRRPRETTLSGYRLDLAVLEEQVRQQEELEHLPSRLEAMAHGHAEAFNTMSREAKQSLLAKLRLRVELGTGFPDSKLKNRCRITMQPTPEMFYGWDEDNDDWFFDVEDLAGEALRILTNPTPTEEQQRLIEEAQKRLSPEQRAANEASLSLSPEERRRIANGRSLTREKIDVEKIAAELLEQLTPEERRRIAEEQRSENSAIAERNADIVRPA